MSLIACEGNDILLSLKLMKTQFPQCECSPFLHLSKTANRLPDLGPFDELKELCWGELNV